MSNWDGKGIPENGQILFCKNTAERAAFIGGCGNGTQWAVELERTGKIVSCPPGWFDPIKTPEQVEEEKAIDGIVELLVNFYGNPKGAEGYIGVAKSLHESGYHNQPKVKALSFGEYYKLWTATTGSEQRFKYLAKEGHIIEAKEQDNE